MATTHSGNKPGPRSFWIGLPLMLLFAGSGLGGSSWAIDRIVLEKSLYESGVLTSAALVRKEEVGAHTSPRTSGGTVYRLIYRFDGGAGEIEGAARVSAKQFFSLRPGQSFQVRYLPEDPTRNLPDGSRLSGLFYIFAIVGGVVGLGASVVVVGMILTRIREG